MKKKFMIVLACILALSAVLMAGCGSNGAKAGGTYTANYDISKDFMTEDEETGALSVTSFPSTPLGPESGLAVAYAGSFGSFVDAVSATATLTVDGDTYTYTYKTQCGTDKNTIGYYAPEFTWSGKVTSKDSTSIVVEAPTSGTVTIHAAGQFATNEEQIGFFGVDGYTANESTTDCPYMAVPTGARLLELFYAGTFSVNGSTIVSYEIAG